MTTVLIATLVAAWLLPGASGGSWDREEERSRESSVRAHPTPFDVEPEHPHARAQRTVQMPRVIAPKERPQPTRARTVPAAPVRREAPRPVPAQFRRPAPPAVVRTAPAAAPVNVPATNAGAPSSPVLKTPLPKPNPIVNPVRLIRDTRPAPRPRIDDRGAEIKARPIERPPDHRTIINNTTIINNITNNQRVEIQRDHYYWHDHDGLRYCHYFDHLGIHWYGFYAGPTYYWTRYFDNRWWWYDASYARWVYWYNGYWWWQDPAQMNSVYVNVDNSYYPYDSLQSNSPKTVQGADGLPDTSPGNAADTFYSDDGARMVQILGERREAFLYDRSGGKDPQFMAFLARDAKEARFSASPAGGSPQILLILNDGAFLLFDSNGKPYAQPAN